MTSPLFMKTPKNSIKVVARGQMLSLVLPRIYCGNPKKLALGISDNPENRKFAEFKAKQIEIDFMGGYFDSTLQKYRRSHLPLPTTESASITLSEIYKKYIDSRKKLVSPSTWKSTYQNCLNHLIACPYKQPEEALKIKDWVIANRSLDSARRILRQANAACEWALDRKLIPVNLFRGKIKINSKKSKPKINPFSSAEKAAILQAFEVSDKFNYLLPIIQFFFLTGCRTSEAIALQWKHVKADCGEIEFEEAIVSAQGGAVRKQGTKQSAGRSFPCNPQLKSLLLSVKPNSDSKYGDRSVFVRPDGKPIVSCDLRTAWYGKGENLGIVKQLASDGAIEIYRPQYNIRHTFISQCLEAGIPPTQIAEWVGNSAEIIFRNYAGIINKASVPEF
jgi:integrase